MHYLHTSSPQIIHRDLKPSNIMLTSNQRGVIGWGENDSLRVIDFGLATTKSSAKSNMTGGTTVGTLRYTAPEVVRKEPFNTKCDVYAFGIILFELFTGSSFWETAAEEEIITAVSRGESGLQLINALERHHLRLQPGNPTDIPPCVLSLIKACITSNPVDRPTFASIQSVLYLSATNEGHALALAEELAQHAALSYDTTSANRAAVPAPDLEGFLMANNLADATDKFLVQKVSSEMMMDLPVGDLATFLPFGDAKRLVAAREKYCGRITALLTAIATVPMQEATSRSTVEGQQARAIALVRAAHFDWLSTNLERVEMSDRHRTAVELSAWWAPFGIWVHVLEVDQQWSMRSRAAAAEFVSQLESSRRLEFQVNHESAAAFLRLHHYEIQGRCGVTTEWLEEVNDEVTRFREASVFVAYCHEVSAIFLWSIRLLYDSEFVTYCMNASRDLFVSYGAMFFDLSTYNRRRNDYEPTPVLDSAATSCFLCRSTFNLLVRRHHCRRCGGIFCGKCAPAAPSGKDRTCSSCWMRSDSVYKDPAKWWQRASTIVNRLPMSELNVRGTAASLFHTRPCRGSLNEFATIAAAICEDDLTSVNSTVLVLQLIYCGWRTEDYDVLCCKITAAACGNRVSLVSKRLLRLVNWVKFPRGEALSENFKWLFGKAQSSTFSAIPLLMALRIFVVDVRYAPCFSDESVATGSVIVTTVKRALQLTQDTSIADNDLLLSVTDVLRKLTSGFIVREQILVVALAHIFVKISRNPRPLAIAEGALDILKLGIESIIASSDAAAAKHASALATSDLITSPSCLEVFVQCARAVDTTASASAFFSSLSLLAAHTPSNNVLLNSRTLLNACLAVIEQVPVFEDTTARCFFKIVKSLCHRRENTVFMLQFFSLEDCASTIPHAVVKLLRRLPDSSAIELGDLGDCPVSLTLLDFCILMIRAKSDRHSRTLFPYEIGLLMKGNAKNANMLQRPSVVRFLLQFRPTAQGDEQFDTIHVHTTRLFTVTLPKCCCFIALQGLMVLPHLQATFLEQGRNLLDALLSNCSADGSWYCCVSQVLASSSLRDCITDFRLVQRFIGGSCSCKAMFFIINQAVSWEERESGDKCSEMFVVKEIAECFLRRSSEVNLDDVESFFQALCRFISRACNTHGGSTMLAWFGTDEVIDLFATNATSLKDAESALWFFRGFGFLLFYCGISIKPRLRASDVARFFQSSLQVATASPVAANQYFFAVSWMIQLFSDDADYCSQIHSTTSREAYTRMKDVLQVAATNL